MNHKKWLDAEVGRYLKQLRENAHVTQRQAAEHLGHKTPQQISNIERGTSPASIDSLALLLNLYNVSLSESIKTLSLFYKKYLEKELL